MPGPQREEDSPFIFGTVERGLALPRGIEDAALTTKTHLPDFYTGRCFFIRIYRLSIIRATISVAALMYSAMLNCLTTRTS